MGDDYRATLRRLTVRDERLLEALSTDASCRGASDLDTKTVALVQIAALIALDASPQSYAYCTDAARHAGASEEEVVGALVATLPVLGAPRVVSAAPKLGLALGYDVEQALEGGTG